MNTRKTLSPEEKNSTPGEPMMEVDGMNLLTHELQEGYGKFVEEDGQILHLDLSLADFTSGCPKPRDFIKEFRQMANNAKPVSNLRFWGERCFRPQEFSSR